MCILEPGFCTAPGWTAASSAMLSCSPYGLPVVLRCLCTSAFLVVRPALAHLFVGRIEGG